MEKGSGKNKKVLIGVLISLGVLIVTLILVIVMVNIGHREVKDEGEVEDDTSHEALVKGDYDKAYNINSNISAIYQTGDKEKALELYDREIESAIANEEYSLFLSLLRGKANLSVLEGNCSRALYIYDTVNMEGLPAEVQAGVYTGAIGQSESCGNDEVQTYFEEKLAKLMEEKDIGEKEPEE